MPGDETERIDTSGVSLRRLAPGVRISGRYVLELLAGRGGMGEVWRAKDEELDRVVALKFLPESVAADREAVRDLKRETTRCLELTHTHIVRVYDFVQDHGTAAIAMEFVDGETLATRKVAAPGGCLSATELAPLVTQLAEALDYAHTKARIVHRDLKPANLLITRTGELKVSDFGISTSLTETRTRLTNSANTTTGTLSYMSPQQLLGDKPQASDDIYAFGATLYELLTGKPPFYRGDAFSLMKQISERPPEPLALHRAEAQCSGDEIPPQWSETILACLEKDPARRPHSAGEVAWKLGLSEKPPTLAREISGDETIVMPSPTTKLPPPIPPLLPKDPKKSKLGLIVGLAVGAVLLVALVTAALRPKAKKSPLSSEPPASVLTTPEPGQVVEQPPTPEPTPIIAAPALPVTAATMRKPWIISDLGLTLMPIAAGSFTMGSPDDEPGHQPEEGPQTRITLTQPYWLGRTEVTQAQWTSVMGNNPSTRRGENLPVEHVSWTSAMAFCQKLTDQERKAGRLPDGYQFSLPTEAQWEYACRAGTTGAFPGNLDDLGWHAANSDSHLAPVAMKQANAWGLFDMSGNVWEWCYDWYADKLPGIPARDFAGPASGVARVMRGGSYGATPANCRSAYRNKNAPAVNNAYLGFRVALVVVR